MARSIILLLAVLLAGVSAAAGYIWNSHIRIHGTVVPVEFASADGTILKGEIYLPFASGPHPAIVGLHGSGPHISSMLAYRVHANAFLKKGGAVLLYDKRGAGRSEGNFDTATYADFIEDALAAVTKLHSHPNIDRGKIGLFGSSEGGWFTPEIAVRDKRIKFVINRAGPPLPWMETNLWEIRNELIAGGIADESLIEKILALRIKIWNYYLDASAADDPMMSRRATLIAELASIDGPWRDIYGMSVAEFEIEKFRLWSIDISYDPTPFLLEMKQPIYAVFSGDDQNVPTVKAVAVLENIRDQHGKNITIKIYPGRTHGMFKWYNLLTVGYPPDYLDSIGDWAAAQ